MGSKTRERNPPCPASPETLAAFSTIPWASSLFTNPHLTPFSNSSRNKTTSNTGDTFLSQTLNSIETISAYQSFFLPPNTPISTHKFIEIITVLKLGSGVNGHIDLCHGGFISLLIDEALGAAAEAEREEDKSSMTVSLKVDYRAAMRTPATVLTRGWIERREGRKIWARGTVEDGLGRILAEGEGLFVTVGKEMVGQVAKL